jgi:hypothetical protein
MRKGRRQMPVFYMKILSPILAQTAWPYLQLRRINPQLIVGCARTNQEALLKGINVVRMTHPTAASRKARQDGEQGPKRRS